MLEQPCGSSNIGSYAQSSACHATLASHYFLCLCLPGVRSIVLTPPNDAKQMTQPMFSKALACSHDSLLHAINCTGDIACEHGPDDVLQV